MESSSVVWNPHLKQDVLTVEAVQRRFSRRVFRKCGLSMRNYSDRLKVLNIETLEYRRLEMDLIMVFRLLHRLVDIKFAKFLKLRRLTYHLRGHRYNLRSDIKTSSIAAASFPNRVITVWNKLPEAVVELKTLETFKAALRQLNLRDFANLLV